MIVEAIQKRRDKTLEWVKQNLLPEYDEGIALEYSNAIQVFVNREILPLLEGLKAQTKTTQEIITLRDSFHVRLYPSEFSEIDSQAFSDFLKQMWIPAEGVLGTGKKEKITK